MMITVSVRIDDDVLIEAADGSVYLEGPAAAGTLWLHFGSSDDEYPERHVRRLIEALTRLIPSADPSETEP